MRELILEIFIIEKWLRNVIIDFAWGPLSQTLFRYKIMILLFRLWL